jgi:hypothetical protein
VHVTDILEWVTSPLRWPWPGGRVDQIKILGRGKTFHTCLACPSVSSTSVVSSFPPNHHHPYPVVQQHINNCAVSLPLQWQFQCQLQATIILRVRISCSTSRATRRALDSVHSQALNDATPWRCLNVGVLCDLLVDAAGRVYQILGYHMP